MNIASGNDAMSRYESFMNGSIFDDADIKKLWQELESYCKLDTIAMVELLKTLRTHINHD